MRWEIKCTVNSTVLPKTDTERARKALNIPSPVIFARVDQSQHWEKCMCINEQDRIFPLNQQEKYINLF